MEKFCINKELLYFAFHLMPQVWKTPRGATGQALAVWRAQWPPRSAFRRLLLSSSGGLSGLFIVATVTSYIVLNLCFVELLNCIHFVQHFSQFQ